MCRNAHSHKSIEVEPIKTVIYWSEVKQKPQLIYTKVDTNSNNIGMK